MKKVLRFVERIVVIALLLMMMVVVILSTLELGWMLIKYLIDPKVPLLAEGELLTAFSFFLLVLIGLELIETIKMYLDKSQIHVEVVFLVAMIAVARKVVVMDAKKYEPLSLIGIAAIILALAGGYFLVKRMHGGLDQKEARD